MSPTKSKNIVRSIIRIKIRSSCEIDLKKYMYIYFPHLSFVRSQARGGGLLNPGEKKVEINCHVFSIRATIATLFFFPSF